MVVVVVDGFGGYIGGWFVSEFVFWWLFFFVYEFKDEDDFVVVINLMNKVFYEEMVMYLDFNRMGVIVVGIFLIFNCLYGFNVGDSWIYEMVFGFYFRLILIDDVLRSDDYDFLLWMG